MNITELKTEEGAKIVVKHQFVLGRFIYQEKDGNYLAINNKPESSEVEVFKRKYEAMAFLKE